jgi:hypothetical protein
MSYGYIGDPYSEFNPNNPFLAMLAAVDGEQEAQIPPPVVPNQQQQQSSEGRVKLPDFWPHTLGIWFARAELRFETSNVVSVPAGRLAAGVPAWGAADCLLQGSIHQQAAR